MPLQPASADLGRSAIGTWPSDRVTGVQFGELPPRRPQVARVLIWLVFHTNTAAE